MRPDETIMEMLARMLQPLVSDADADEIADYLSEQNKLRQARDARLRERLRVRDKPGEAE